jgi:truncated hemoglobin YjbI
LANRATLLAAIGGEAGCRRLSEDFYARVGTDPVLRRLFPGKSLKCAIEEFGAFLIQFLEGDEEQTQRRWWLSLRESHARFRISPEERRAWLKHMQAALQTAPLEQPAREALRNFFEHSSAYVIGKESPAPEDEELAARWTAQRTLDDAVAFIAAGRDDEAIALAQGFRSRPAIFAALLARMLRSGRAAAIAFALESVQLDPSLGTRRFAGRTLLHCAAAAGCLEMLTLLLGLGIDPDIRDSGGHTPLYCASNECASPVGPAVVRALVHAGADVNARTGVTRATALHMAARRGHLEIARALLDCGASIHLRDSKGDTPLERALHCRREKVAQFLLEQGDRHITRPR